MIALEIEVVHVLCPEAVAIGSISTGIAGKGTIAYPLHAVYAGIQ